MRSWLALACTILLLSGCSYLKKGSQNTAEKMNQERKAELDKPVWNPVYDSGPGYELLEGKAALREMTEFRAEPGSTFYVKVRDYALDKEGHIRPTPSGVVYLEQLLVKTLRDRGYEHVPAGRADYAVELHMLCLDPVQAAQAKTLEKGLLVPEYSEERFPFPWNREYHAWTAPGQTPPGEGCTAYALLAVHVPAKVDKEAKEKPKNAGRDVFVTRLAVSGCPAERNCPVSACGYLAGRTLTQALERAFP